MPDDMLTTAEVAERIGLTVGSLQSYIPKGRFPRPDGYLGRTPWWSVATVERWLANRRPMGRPKKDG